MPIHPLLTVKCTFRKGICAESTQIFYKYVSADILIFFDCFLQKWRKIEDMHILIDDRSTKWVQSFAFLGIWNIKDMERGRKKWKSRTRKTPKILAVSDFSLSCFCGLHMISANTSSSEIFDKHDMEDWDLIMIGFIVISFHFPRLALGVKLTFQPVSMSF